MNNLKCLSRIKLLLVNELSPRVRRIFAKHDERDFNDELGKDSQCFVVREPGFRKSPAGTLARGLESVCDIRSNELSRCVIKSPLLTRIAVETAFDSLDSNTTSFDRP